MTSPGLDDIGSMMTIRVVDADGHTRDLVGTLLRPGAILRRDGTECAFDPATVTHWRLIPLRVPRAGTGAPLSVRIRELEQAMALTWPAEITQEHDGWLLRAARGVTYRANSALPIGPPPLGTPAKHLDEAIIRTIGFAREHGIVPMIQVPMPAYSTLDSTLESCGWALALEGVVMVADAPEVTTAASGSPAPVILEDEPTLAWLSVQPDVTTEAIMRRCPARYAVALAHGAPVGTGRIALASGWGVISSVFITADARNSGLGRAVMRELAASASGAGCSRLALQVNADNRRAIDMYERLGFRVHHRYRHRSFTELQEATS